MLTRLLIRRLLPTLRLSPGTTSTYKIVKQNSQWCENVNIKVMSNFYSEVQYRLYSVPSNVESLTVDYEYVKEATGNSNIVLVDVREPDEIKEHGKIPNSINIPLADVSTVLSTMSKKEFEETYNRPKPSDDTQIIFYCMIGKRSGMAQQNALNIGFRNVKNYLGSWTDWANKSQKQPK